MYSDIRFSINPYSYYLSELNITNVVLLAEDEITGDGSGIIVFICFLAIVLFILYISSNRIAQIVHGIFNAIWVLLLLVLFFAIVIAAWIYIDVPPPITLTTPDPPPTPVPPSLSPTAEKVLQLVGLVFLGGVVVLVLGILAEIAIPKIRKGFGLKQFGEQVSYILMFRIIRVILKIITMILGGLLGIAIGIPVSFYMVQLSLTEGITGGATIGASISWLLFDALINDLPS